MTEDRVSTASINPGPYFRDGGIKIGNTRKIIAAGADTLVVGSAVYAPDVHIESALHALRAEVEPGPEMREER